jgi:hypothetical protein
LKLWSVYPNLFRGLAVRSVAKARSSGSPSSCSSRRHMLQLFTGFLNVLGWSPVAVALRPGAPTGLRRHRSILLHIGVKLPDIAYGLRTRLAEGDVLTETPWSDNPHSHSNAGGHVPPPPTTAITRRRPPPRHRRRVSGSWW